LIDSCYDLNIFCGDSVDLETLFLAKSFLNKKGYSYITSYLNSEFLNLDFRYNYLGDSSIDFSEGIIVLLGSDLRKELPLLNIKLRKLVLDNKIKIITINSNNNFNLNHTNLSFNLNSLKILFKGKSLLSYNIKNAKKVYFLLGSSLIQRNDFNDIFKLILLFKHKNKNNIFIKFLHKEISKVGNFELGIMPGINDFNDCSKFNFNIYNKKLFYLLGVNDVILNSKEIYSIIYQGTHGDDRLKEYNFISGITYFIETTSTYLNLEGIVQKTKFIQVPPKNLRTGWSIFQMLSYF
jgi:NADH-quinone oxidoreductase subunit G